MGLTHNQAGGGGGGGFLGLSESRTACEVMDHGASDGSSGVGPGLERMGTLPSRKQGGVLAGK